MKTTLDTSMLILAISENFKQYNGVEELLSLSEADIKQMGVRNSAHRARMVSNLLVLREKYHQAKNGGKYIELNALIEGECLE